MVERLKTALERARNERQRGHLATNVASDPDRNTLPSSGLLPVPSETDWSAIPEANIDPRRLGDARIQDTSAAPQDQFGFDALRARLHRLCDQRKLRRIGLTAASSGCGATTFALNLAFSFARQTQAKVLLFDLQLNAPAIARRLGLSTDAALTSVLSGQAPDKHVLNRFGKNLLVAASEKPDRHQTNREREADIGKFVDRLQTRFCPDLVLLDLAPVLQSDSAVAVLEQTDAALLIASAEETTAQEVDDSARRIAEVTQYLGAALNKSRERSSRSSTREFA